MTSQLFLRGAFLAFRIATFMHVASSQAIHETSKSLKENANYFFYQRSEYPKDCQDAQRQCSSSISSGVYVIKPEGFQEPFEVYCDHHVDQGGWTVIQRRGISHLAFVNRTWSQYKDGFGYLSTDFWIGNEKLSYLTNQAAYELRIDVEMFNGASFYSTYDAFRITDEFGEYKLKQIGSLASNGSSVISSCPQNMKYGTCICQGTCEDPKGESGCYSNCSKTEECLCSGGFLMNGSSCIRESECSCFLSDENLVIPNGETYVNHNCTKKCSCTNNQLNCEDEFSCGDNAACSDTNGVRQCICNEGYEGDGQICDPLFTDCHDVYLAEYEDDGLYTILPSGWTEGPFRVYCDIESDGGWTVIQSHVDDTISFNQNWTMYRNGFGNLEGSFWLGNEKLHYLTIQKGYKLRFEITTSSGSPLQADFAEFEIESENQYYRMNKLGTRTAPNGSAGCYLSYNKGKKFSTYDRDNDDCGNFNCAEKHRSGWWHSNNWCSNCYGSYCDYFLKSGSCHTLCTDENPNGDYNGGNGQNMFSCYYNYCNLRSVKMKILPLRSQQ